MMVWMFIDLIFVDKKGLQWLRRGKIYEIPDYWARLIVENEDGAKFIKVK